MISVTVNGQSCWLLNQEPNTDTAKRLEVEMAAESVRSLTGRASQRPQAVLPRWSQHWLSLLDSAAFASLRNASLAAQDEPVLAPVWDFQWDPATESPALDSGLIIAWDDGWTDWEINPEDPEEYAHAAPLLFGRWAQPVRLVSISGDLCQAELTVQEDAPAGYAIAPAAGILSADTVDGGWAVFPFAALADWSRPPAPGPGLVDVERIALGPGRMQASIFYAQAPERTVRAHFAAVGRTAAAQLIAWWIRRGGTAEAHKVPLADLGVAEGGTIVARHTGPRLVLSWLGPFATCDLAWREAAVEADLPGDETAGETVGRLPAEAWFFKLELDFNGALQTWHLTNWESGAYVNLIEWSYNACDFDGLTQSIDLEDDVCECTFRYFANGPWDNWLPGNLAARGTLTLYRAKVTPAGVFSGFAQVWRGELRRPEVDGPIVKWRSVANALFGRNAPRQLMSTVCGTMLFKPRCGLALADWTFNATITAVLGAQITVGTITRANTAALPEGFGTADWFALGWLGWSASGRPYRAAILGSQEIGSGEIVLTLERPIAPGVSSAVQLVPGCDRLRGSGCAKFANEDNFRGFDLMPAIAPSFIIPQRTVSAAKK